jgi:hypothetical protein
MRTSNQGTTASDARSTWRGAGGLPAPSRTAADDRERTPCDAQRRGPALPGAKRDSPRCCRSGPLVVHCDSEQPQSQMSGREWPPSRCRPARPKPRTRTTLIVERRAARFAAPGRLAILRRLGMAGRLAAFALILVGAAMHPGKPARARKRRKSAAPRVLPRAKRASGDRAVEHAVVGAASHY